MHAHQIVLEVLSETGGFGLLLWLAGVALAWRAWRYADEAARERARPAMLALAVTVFPFNTHLAFYSTFWGGLTLLLAALYAGSLLARQPITRAEPSGSGVARRDSAARSSSLAAAFCDDAWCSIRLDDATRDRAARRVRCARSGYGRRSKLLARRSELLLDADEAPPDQVRAAHERISAAPDGPLPRAVAVLTRSKLRACSCQLRLFRSNLR